jgi:hypothetical protein
MKRLVASASTAAVLGFLIWSGLSGASPGPTAVRPANGSSPAPSLEPSSSGWLVAAVELLNDSAPEEKYATPAG